MLAVSDLRRHIPGLLVLIAAASLLSFRISTPATFVFDEIYYANDALDLLTTGSQRSFVVHPPFAKVLMTPGIELFGFTPFGWRFDSVVAGTLAAFLTYLIARRITGSEVLSLLAATLLLTDGTFFTAARVAMLDIYVCLITLVLLWVLLSRWFELKPRTAGVVAAVLLGMDIASKWSALPLLVVIPIVAWRWGGHLRSRLVGSLVVVVVVLTTYTASYAGWIFGGNPAGNCVRIDCGSTVLARLGALPNVQRSMFDAERSLHRTNPNLAPGWTWIAQRHPTVLFRETCTGQRDAACEATDHSIHEVRSQGSKVLWPLGTVAVVGLVSFAFYRRIRHRETPGARTIGARLVVTFALALYVPWLAYSQTYSFYGAPLVPLLAIAVPTTIAMVQPALARCLLAVAIAVGAIVTFVLQWPALIG